MLSLERCKMSPNSLREDRNETTEPEIITPVEYLANNKTASRGTVTCGIQFVLPSVIKWFMYFWESKTKPEIGSILSLL